MPKIKDLLSERQIHRFMKLAEISSLGETEELEESTEVTEEAEELEESTEVTEEAEELEEGGLADRDDPRNRRNTPRSRPMEEGEVSEGEEVVEESAAAQWAQAGEGGGGEAYYAAAAPDTPESFKKGELRKLGRGVRKAQGKPAGLGRAGRRELRQTFADAPQSPDAPRQRDIDTGDLERVATARDPIDRDRQNAGALRLRSRQFARGHVAPVRESQMRDLVGRIKARIMQESHKVQGMTREASFEQQVRLVEAQMAQNIERNRAIHQRESLTEVLVERVVNRLKELKK